MMKKAIVTGAGGFIGSALTKKLLQNNVAVIGIDVSEKTLEKFKHYDNFSMIIADFSKYDKLHKIIKDEEIDVFYHFAWQGVFGDAFKDYQLQLSNAKYACDAFAEAAKMKVKKFVFAGTMNEYEMNTYIAKDEFRPRYTYIYSAVKQVSEAICKTLSFNSDTAFCAGRIAMAFGENNKSRMLPNVVMKNLLDGVPSKLIEGNNLYDMIYIDDIAEAFIAIGEKGKNMRSYYVGHREIRTFKEIITEMASALNSDAPLLFGEYPDEESGIDYSCIDTEALYRDTGFECQSDFRQSIIKTADWIKCVDF